MPISWKKLDKAKAVQAALDTALTVLETTENVLNTTPIPGAAAIITVILELLKRQERASSNAKRTVEQQERWKKLIGQLEECETDPDSTPQDALFELREASQALASKLKEHARELRESTAHELRPRWMTCTSDEEAVQEFLRKSNEAIADYQYAQGRRIEECVVKIHNIVGAMNTTVNRIDITFQADREDGKFKEFDRAMETRRAPLASYNAPRRVGTLSRCSEGTRVPLLQTVSNWIKDPAADKVFWLKERAGFGKTAIALSVAEHADNEGILAASFFFSYQIPDLSNTTRLLPTIIYQLCLFGGAPYKQRFAAAIAEYPGLLDAKLKHQEQKFFLDPLKDFPSAPADPPIVIVIDALDECQHEDAEDLTTFIAALLSLELPFKVFITSRPECQITAPFSDLGVEPRAIEDTSNKDVETYLRDELAMISSKPGIRALNLPRDWVREEDIQRLLELAGAKRVNKDRNTAEKALFVYIATVVRFIGDTRRCNPRKLLKIVLSATPPLPTYRTFQALDNLYTRVLDLAFGGEEDLLQQFHVVMGGMIAMKTNESDLQPIRILENLLNLPRGEVQRTLVNLESVIQYPNTDSTLPSFHHRSFPDFLADKNRSGSLYYIEVQHHQKCLALGCLRVIATSPLKVEITKALNVEDYFYYPRTQLSPELMHASCHLADYSEVITGDKDFLKDLEEFIRQDFGWWIELLPQITIWNFDTISNAADPHDEQKLVFLFRILVSKSAAFRNVDKRFHVLVLVRKELRRYILAVTQRQEPQGGDSRMEIQALFMSIKKHMYKLKVSIGCAGEFGWKAVCVAIVAFAKDAEAAVDKYQVSIGNQEEVESSRKRTILLRSQVKPLLVDKGWITDDGLFEEEGIWN